MAIVKKKMWPGYFEDISSGKKKYDWRLNDFEINEGDTLVLEEWDPETKDYTGRQIEKEVGYILKTKNITFFSKADAEKYGYQVIGFK